MNTKDLLLFDEHSKPTKVQATAYTNGLELTNGIFLPLDHLDDYAFSDMLTVQVHGSEAENMHLSPLFRAEQYATKYTQHETVEESIQFLSEKIDALCRNIDSAVESIKSAKESPEELRQLLRQFHHLVETQVEPTFTFSVKELATKAIKIPVHIEKKRGKIPLIGVIDSLSEKILISDSIIAKYPDVANEAGRMLRIEGIASTPMHIRTINLKLRIFSQSITANVGIVPDLEARIGYPLLLNIEVFNMLVKSGKITMDFPDSMR